MTTNPPVVVVPGDTPAGARDVAHRAAYLILLGAERTAPKALLFNAEHRYLSEVFDDGFIVDHLRSTGTRCVKPGSISLDGVLPANTSMDDAQVLCFALGRRAA